MCVAGHTAVDLFSVVLFFSFSSIIIRMLELSDECVVVGVHQCVHCVEKTTTSVKIHVGKSKSRWKGKVDGSEKKKQIVGKSKSRCTQHSQQYTNIPA